FLYRCPNILEVRIGDGGVHRKHDGGLAQFPGYGIALWRTHPLRKRFFQVDLTACTRVTRNAFRIDGSNELVTVPAFAQSVRTCIAIEPVVRMMVVRGRRRGAHPGKIL